MDNVSLKGTMHTTHRCKVRWVALEPHGATSLSTQGRVFSGENPF